MIYEKSSKLRYRTPFKNITDEFHTPISIEPNLNTHAYNDINQLEEAYSAFKIEK